MKKILLSAAFLLGSSMFVMGQQGSNPASTPPTLPPSEAQPQTQAPDQSTSQQSTMPSSQSSMGQEMQAQTVEGCLSQSSSGAGFTLTDSSGKTYELQGESSQLSGHVGEEVRVKGKASASTSTSAASASAPSGQASAAAQQTLMVQSVKRIAKSCSASPTAK